MDFILRVVCPELNMMFILRANKTYTPFSSHIIFVANSSAILIGTIL